MNLIFTLAWRNLWRNRKRTFITMSSVFFAVILAILFFSMEEGSYKRMIDSLVTYSTGYIQIQDVLYQEEPSIDHAMLFDEAIEELLEKYSDRISFYVPRLQNFALVAAENTTRGSMIMGIDIEKELLLNDLSKDITAGEFLTKSDEGLLVAKGLATILGVGIGDTLVLLGQGFQGATAAGKYPVRGIVDLKIPELNNNILYMTIENAQWFYGADERLTSLIIMPVNPAHTHRLTNEMLADIDREWYNILTWEEMLKDLLALMKFDMAGTMVLMIILYIVIAFGLYGTMLMILIERQKEFALLFSIGMKRSILAAVCFLETLFMSLAGTLMGVIGAIPIVAYFNYNPIRLTGQMAEAIAEYGFEPILPFSSDPAVFYTQALYVMILSVIIGLYPVKRVFQLNILDAKH
ncbi:MAG: ABC transporter permease [Bacteroidetes bacterium]|nr:MAG: ABC transporter permease [Bacteroidota bacterium]